MRTRLRNLLELWGDSGLLVSLSLVTGTVLEGRVKELDNDELILEPVVDGVTGKLTVVQLAHVVSATFLDDAS